MTFQPVFLTLQNRITKCSVCFWGGTSLKKTCWMLLPIETREKGKNPYGIGCRGNDLLGDVGETRSITGGLSKRGARSRYCFST